MTADDRWFADVCRHLGRPAPSLEKLSQDAKATVTAAVISKPRLLVVTVDVSARGGPKVDQGRSRAFELADRSAFAIRNLRREISGFFQRQRIDRVYLRAKSADGQFIGHPWNYKIETVLQLEPGLELTFVDTNSIGAWVLRTEPELPDSPFSLGAACDAKQRQAIQAAVFVAQNPDHTRAFSDGSKCDG